MGFKCSYTEGTVRRWIQRLGKQSRPGSLPPPSSPRAGLLACPRVHTQWAFWTLCFTGTACSALQLRSLKPNRSCILSRPLSFPSDSAPRVPPLTHLAPTQVITGRRAGLGRTARPCSSLGPEPYLPHSSHPRLTLQCQVCTEKGHRAYQAACCHLHADLGALERLLSSGLMNTWQRNSRNNQTHHVWRNAIKHQSSHQCRVLSKNRTSLMEKQHPALALPWTPGGPLPVRISLASLFFGAEGKGAIPPSVSSCHLPAP